MAQDIKLMKLINGEMVIGKHAPDEGKLKEVALLQTVPTEQGVQMLILPYGYPFEQDIKGDISLEHVLYEYSTYPEDLQSKYLQASSNLTISSPGALRNLDLAAKAQGGSPSFSDILKK
ncbi:MAG: hypothetical protein D6E12_12080 [Desulfovibrio sp.]|nr:MAG: hypothetical protein D6E12_12080 [Desulfovibrio sp.]